MRPYFLLLLALLTAATCRAQQPLKIKRPFLWTIQSANDVAPVTKAHLFGTIHVPDTTLTTLHKDAQKVWNNSTAAYFEVDFQKDSAAQTKAISLSADQRMEDLVPPELLKRLDNRLARISPGMSRQLLPKLHVAVWPLLLGNLEAQARHLGKLSLDMKLYAEARIAGKTVGGLEKPGEQLTAVRNLSMADQVEFLKASLDAMDEDDRNGIKRLDLTKTLYAEGDEQAFSEFLEAEFSRARLSPQLLHTVRSSLLYDRNVTMAAEIKRLMHDRPNQRFFFAVGIGHLVGDKTIQDQLRKIGFVVQRVEKSADGTAGGSPCSTPEAPR